MTNLRQVALHAHALSSLEQADMALAHATELSIDEPHLPAHITREFFQTALGGRGRGRHARQRGERRRT